MGLQHAYVTIGNLLFEWNEFMPTPAPNFLTFLFDESEMYKKVEDVEYENSDTGEVTVGAEIQAAGFRSTAAKCMRVLDSYGYNLSLFIEIYKFFRKDLRDDLLALYNDGGNSRQVYNLASTIDALTPEEEVSSYINFIRSSIATNFKEGIFKEKIKLTFGEPPKITRYVSGSKYILSHHFQG